MQFYWLNKENNNKLIIFFAGWSFDENPFKFLACNDYDVLICYDYNTLIENKYKIFQNLDNYKHKYLIAWSMGVYMAYQIRNILPHFDKKIAINGTPFPVDDECGIPQKPFLLTLKHAKTGLEGKFYQNIFDKKEEFEHYTKTPVKRSIDNRIEELNELYKKIQKTQKKYQKYYDLAYISNQDKIIPAKNQLNFWKKYSTQIKQLESGHFPYYNFENWKELL